MRVKNSNSLFFSIASLALYSENGGLLCHVDLPGGLDISGGLTPEQIESRGGFAALAQSVRAGNLSGEFTITMNECPPELERAMFGGSLNALAANANATISSVQHNRGGSTLDAITVTATANMVAQPGEYLVEATAAGQITVTALTPNGRQVFADLDATASQALGGVGITVDASSTAVDVGDAVSFSVAPAHGGGQVVSIPSNPKHQFYSLKAWSVAGRSPDDALVEIHLRKVMLLGGTMKLTNNEATSGVEVQGKFVDSDNGDPVRISHWNVANA